MDNFFSFLKGLISHALEWVWVCNIEQKDHTDRLLEPCPFLVRASYVNITELENGLDIVFDIVDTDLVDPSNNLRVT